MILCTHAVVGAALASFLPSHPAAAFVVGFASHFAIDAIPHWDYPIRSRSVNPMIAAPIAFDRALLRDAAAIGSDGLFGVAVALYLFSSSASLWAILLGAIGAMLPDPLQFVHGRWPYEPQVGMPLPPAFPRGPRRHQCGGVRRRLSRPFVPSRKHMALHGLPREKVLGTVVSLLETTLIRIGNDDYAKQGDQGRGREVALPSLGADLPVA